MNLDMKTFDQQVHLINVGATMDEETFDALLKDYNSLPHPLTDEQYQNLINRYETKEV